MAQINFAAGNDSFKSYYTVTSAVPEGTATVEVNVSQRAVIGAGFFADPTVVVEYGSQTDKLSFNPGPGESQSKTVTVNPGSTVTISVAGVYTDETATVVVPSLPAPNPSDIMLVCPFVDPPTLVVGEERSFTVRVVNTSPIPGLIDVAFKVNGSAEYISEVQVPENGQNEVGFTVSFDDPGDYEISLDAVSTSPQPP